MKRQKAVTAALRTGEISRQRRGLRWEDEIEERMEGWRKEEKPWCCGMRVGGDVFYVTAVPYCPQKMSLCPWEAALRGETHLSDCIYRDVPWPHPDEPGRPPTALCLPTLALIVSPKTYKGLDLSATHLYFGKRLCI